MVKKRLYDSHSHFWVSKLQCAYCDWTISLPAACARRLYLKSPPPSFKSSGLNFAFFGRIIISIEKTKINTKQQQHYNDIKNEVRIKVTSEQDTRVTRHKVRIV